MESEKLWTFMYWIVIFGAMEKSILNLIFILDISTYFNYLALQYSLKKQIFQNK